MSKIKRIRGYLWIWSLVYLVLSLFNILFAWLGLLCFILPLFISVLSGKKSYCHHYCGRGQLLNKLGNNLKLSRNKPMPTWLKHKYFRYGFLTFFMFMFLTMLLNTFFVFQGVNTLKEAITILWMFRLPWSIIEYNSDIPNWIIQFGFGFYSLMLTSTILGLFTMILYKPRSWCVYCPMGTMTQVICKLRNK